jgi:hypothetical protein
LSGSGYQARSPTRQLLASATLCGNLVTVQSILGIRIVSAFFPVYLANIPAMSAQTQ